MKKKNAVRKDGRIAVQTYLGRDPETGKRKYKTSYGRAQTQAQEKADGVRLKLRKGLDVSAEQDSFSQWAARWLAHQELSLTDKQYKNYLGYVAHLNDAIGYIPISKLSSADIQEAIDTLAVRNPHTHKPTAKKTLTDIRGTAFQIMQYAIDNRLLDYNPVGPVKVPQNSPQSHRRALTEEEQKWILDTPHRAQRAAMIMMYAGLRRGELIPLTWHDIDFDAHTISVNKATYEVKGKLKIKPITKTAAGMRTIDIPLVLVDFLREELKKEKTQEKNSKVSTLNALVCPAASGGMYSTNSWKSMWHSYLVDLNFKYGNRIDQAGRLAKSKYNSNGIEIMIPKFTAHWLRHTFATLLYLSGVDILTAKAQLGHADVKTTLQIYTHLDSIYKRNSMRKLDDYLGTLQAN